MQEPGKENFSRNEAYMHRCIELTKIAKQRGESPVGALILLEDKILGSGIEGVKMHLDFTFHAEIEAIRQASRVLDSPDLSGCVLYTTHEPCVMCAYVIRHAQIGSLVIGVTTPYSGGLTSLYPLLSDISIPGWAPPPDIITGVLENACRLLGQQ